MPRAIVLSATVSDTLASSAPLKLPAAAREEKVDGNLPTGSLRFDYNAEVGLIRRADGTDIELVGSNNLTIIENEINQLRTPVTEAFEYWCDSVNGLDTNPGTQELPFKTVDRAWAERLKRGDLRPATPCNIHLLGLGPYTWSNRSRSAAYSQGLTFVGHVKFVVATFNKTGAIDTVTNSFTTSQATATNYRGNFVRYLDGAHKGQVANIESSGVGTMTLLATPQVDGNGAIEVFVPATQLIISRVGDLSGENGGHRFVNLALTGLPAFFDSLIQLSCCTVDGLALTNVSGSLTGGFTSADRLGLTAADVGASVTQPHFACGIITPSLIVQRGSYLSAVFTQHGAGPIFTTDRSRMSGYIALIDDARSDQSELAFVRVKLSAAGKLFVPNNSYLALTVNALQGSTTELYGVEVGEACDVSFEAGAVSQYKGSVKLGSAVYATPFTALHNETTKPLWTEPTALFPFWGLACGNDTSLAAATWGAQIAAAGVKSLRGFVDNRPAYDASIANGFEVTGLFQYYSGAAHFPVDDLAGWINHVTSRVNNYPETLNWEIWNEPPNFAGNQPLAADYANLVSVAYDTAKAINSRIRIGIAAKSTYMWWLYQTLQELTRLGAAHKFDYVTVHPYEIGELVQRGWEGQYLATVPNIRKVLRGAVPDRADVPVVFTEIGAPLAVEGHNGGISSNLQVDMLVKVYTMGAAQGAAGVHWFEPWDGDYVPSDPNSLPHGLIDRATNLPRAAYTALQTLITRLGNVPKYLGWIQLNGATSQEIAFAFENGTNLILVAWTPIGGSLALTFSSTVNVISPEVGTAFPLTSWTVTERPIILVSASGTSQYTTWRTALYNNQGRPFRWGGTDRTNAASVTITGASGPAGVYLINPPATSVVDVYTVYDWSGRANAPSFTVDPNFVSWDTTRLQITAVLHRMTGADAFFNVLCERTGYRDYNAIGSYSGGALPVGTRSTVTWTVDNAQLYGQYGYHFTFSTDNNVNQSYFAIESVTVTRL